MKRILCIDDDLPIREMLKDLLTEMGYQVTVAQDGEEGLKLWQRDPFDLVVTDLLVPKLDGIRLAERLREKKPDAKVLVITAITHSLEKELQGAPIDGWFPKPIPFARLKARVKELVPL